jgi:hypothetical protein
MDSPHSAIRNSASHLVLLALLLLSTSLVLAQRPRPYPVVPDKGFREAIEAGTRMSTGIPGPKYWQNTADYRIHVRVLPELKRLEGRVAITYRHNGPDTLRSLRVQLLQNIHSKGAMRLIPQEVTEGYVLNTVIANGERLKQGGRTGARYMVNGTMMAIMPSTPVPPKGSATIEVDFAYQVPKAGISGRMGYDTDSLFYFGYWYPQMAVFNDVVGWQDDPFFGMAEFYSPFGTYDYAVDIPDDWLVHGTGVLQNPKETLSDETLKRLSQAEKSDATVRIAGPEDFGKATRPGKNGWHTWKFKAEQVRDVAFVATRSSIWEAARTKVGDRDGDGKADYAMCHAFWRPAYFRWARSVEYTQKSIAFLSEFTGLPYPWPHMTAVEGDKIMGGGMEFPMMTLIGGYNNAGDMALLGVTAHEEAHMWMPMIVNTDERRYGWMDEGTTSFHTDEAMRAIPPDSLKPRPDSRFSGYLMLARMEGEGEIMRWSNFHNNGMAYGVASYPKPASILHMLRGVLGEEMFLKAFRTFIKAWAFKHPYPWDMFNTFSTVSGKNLDWFVRSWYYETWTLDHAVTGVKETAVGTEITVEDKGWVPMPVLLTVTRADGSTEDLRLSEEEWLIGRTKTTVTVKPGSPVVKVEIDPKYYFADIDRKNNVWTKAEESK